MPCTKERARYSALRRYRPETDEVVVEAKRDLRAARLADYIARAVAEAPPLSAEQRETLALLLRGPSTRAKADPSAEGAAA